MQAIPTSWLYASTYNVSFSTIMQNLVAGTIGLMQHPLSDIPTVWNSFPIIVGGIIGLVGFGVGIGKGHNDYSEKRSASSFRTWTFWLAVALVITLLILDNGGNAIAQAFQYSQGYN